MPTLEDELRRLMADDTARLHAAPDLLERVVRSHRARRSRVKAVAVAASVAAALVVVGGPAVYLSAGPAPTAGGPGTTSAVPEPPAIDDTPPAPTEPANLGDLGDGKEFGHVKVGYLPERLVWGNWSIDHGDSYSTSYNYKGDDEGSYRVQIFVYENGAVQELEDRLQTYRDEEEGQEVTVGGRSGYQVVTNVGEDGMAGTPTLFLKLGDRQWAEITFSPVYAKEFRDAEAVTAELNRIGEGLTSTL
ncbi:unnamed protein product [[Actinomadura] parvosata subsp. kistnae]|uniref:DUF4367 domain-containing protein n=1 Tax=[Actinomadura] parvosata subsp. kistnae TaxID=1909395 RepID=A0A1V0AB82_9ACTN|nr:hypothetical protein [Nonomuraea sp. ATCC 55076]AQZ67466.1 hypothetical protein BKM31_43765 [Nonomuraea sp. ATCC 55076]SPL94280.1 unnamed protein product [Actinomadura parvosata subsp. kistnae]